MTRRSWLATLGAAALAAPRAMNFGAQLYTLRRVLPHAAPAALQRLAAAGYKEVEILRADLARLRPLLAGHGLACPSAHIETPIVTGNWDLWRKAAGAAFPAPVTAATVAAELKAAGVRYAVIAYLLPGDERRDPAAFADRMNRAGEVFHKAGIQLVYHHHAFEFDPAPGRRAFDVLFERFDPKLVAWQCDVFWAAVAGEDPARLLAKLRGRVPLVHLKDKLAALPRGFSEDVGKEAFREAGAGGIDFRAVLDAAQAAGVRHFFVEQDETEGDPVVSLERSLAHLKRL